MLVIAGCGSSGDSTTETTVTSGSEVTTSADTTAVETTAGETTGGETTATATPEEGCLPPEQQPSVDSKPSFDKAEDVLTSKDASIVMETSCGKLTIKLDQEIGGPIPNSIAFLASKGFYDGLTFHRVVPDFVLQGGDPEGNGSGGPGYEVVGPAPDGYQYKVGDVAMAKTATAPSGASGSQFFVVSSENGAAGLSQMPDYGVLGHATDPESMKTIENIAALGVTDGPPSQPVWIISAKVEQ